MALLGGGLLRLLQTFLYALAFGASAIVLGFYSYFLAVLSDRDLVISNDWRAVEGISGAAVLYTIVAVILTCCLGGIAFFGFVAVVLNVLFAIAFIAVAALTRDGSRSCSGNVTTPIGSGPSDLGLGWDSTDTSRQYTYAVKLGTACHYNQAAFACSVIAIFLFLLLAIFQVLLVRHGKKEKQYGPGPNNGYTVGSGKRRFWQRRGRNATTAGGLGHAEKGHVDTRPSHDTAYTGSTVAGGAPAPGLATDAVPTHGHGHGHSTHGT